MKNYLVFWCFLAVFLASAVFGQQAQKAAPKAPEPTYINVMADPVNPQRELDWDTECLVSISRDEIREFRVQGGSGEITQGRLHPGTTLVVDKNTGVAKWVRVCGNPILDPFVPKGVKDCGREAAAQSQAQAQVQVQVPKIQVQEREIPIKLEVPKFDVQIHERTVPIQPEQEVRKVKRGWKKWFLIGGAIAGGSIYLLTRDKEAIKIFPRVGVISPP